MGIKINIIICVRRRNVKMKKVFGDYYLGLDIGTESIGWAITDLNYNIQKFNGKAMWGIRLFEEATPAAERRLFRSARRRGQRKVQRIKLVQELFAEEICKVDPGFYRRMQDSKFYIEDKSEEQSNTLFNDGKYNDADFHNEFPTIYHLRKALIENNKEYDVRLLYLAVHHIIKHRGHFLFEGQNMESVKSFENIYKDLNQELYDELNISFECNETKEVEEILKDRSLGISKKSEKLNDILNPKDKQEKDIIKLISGGKVKLSSIFADETLNGEGKTDIQFSKASYEEAIPEYNDILQERFYLIEKMKAVYDWGILAEIMDGEKFLSYAKVKVYDKHAKDLAILKRVIKKYHSAEYKNVFCVNGAENYCAYIGTYKKNGKKKNTDNKCNQEELYKYLKKVLSDTKTNDAEYNYLIQEIETNNLLPKQVSKDNGTIPYQLHREELLRILENAAEYLPFLNQKDETQLSVKEKIIKILEFRIPYYVGPLNDAHKGQKNGFAWIVKKSDNRIYPWNFEEVVDVKASAEEFIKRMTNKCTYLIGADVLPKNSLLYSKFMVLNELNNLKINQNDISVELKQNIYNDLFKKYKKVSAKRLREYLRCNNCLSEHDEISGIDGDFKASLTSYIELKEIVGDKVNDTASMEDVIASIVLFGDDKKLLRSKLQDKHGSQFTKEEISKLCNKKYSGWGRLSKEFLEDVEGVNHETGEIQGIIQAMWDTNNNLMQLLSNEYDYQRNIEAYNSGQKKEHNGITYEMVDDLYVSPSVKRMLWQTLTIVKELRKIMGHEPKRIFIEMARGPQDTGRTVSRRNSLIELYKKCSEETKDWVAELEAREDSELRRDALYLYYTQMGKCMYSGEPIELSRLYDSSVYDIDHIYPQSKTKDDSLNNRVLVRKDWNAEKSDTYPLPQNWQTKQARYWHALFEKGFISKVKYERLTRKTPLSDEERANFIARQIVETRQTSKAAASILKEVFSESEIVYVKAGNVSDFRRDYDMIKVREVNDYHHAKDAFLNIVVGNVYHTKFTSNPFNYVKKHEYRDYNLNRMFDSDVNRGEKVAWQAGKNGTLKSVKETMAKNNILFTRYAIEGKGGFFDQMLVRKGSGQVSIKEDSKYSIEKYGGYNKATGAFFILVEHEKKNKTVRTIEFVPLYLVERLDGNKELLKQYCKDYLKLKNPQILMKKIKVNSLFRVNGFYMHLSGRTSARLLFKGANQLLIDDDSYAYVKKIVNYVNRCAKQRIKAGELEVTEFDKISTEENLNMYNLLLEKLKNSVYGIRLGTQVTTLETKKENYIKLKASEQSAVLYELLHLFQCNSVASNLKKIGGPGSAGILVLSNDITQIDDIVMINQSPTGLFEQRVNLLEV